MQAIVALSVFATLVAAGDVVQLTPDNFDTEVGNADFELVLVKFYAPWCGHCKAMAADYEAAATQLKESNPKIKLAEFDADAHRDFSTKFEVQGFPTLKIFRNGDLKSPDDYNGPRTIEGLVKTVAKLSRPAITEFATVAEMEKAIETATADGETVVSGQFKGEGKDVDAFKKFAKKASKSFTVFIVPSGADARQIAIQAPGDEAVIYNDSKLSAAKLTAFADKNKFPPYAEISQDNFKAYTDRGLPLGWMFIDPSKAEETKEVETIMKAAGQKYKGKISLVYLSGTQYGSMAERVGLDGKEFPSFGIDDTATKKHYAFKPEGAVPNAEAIEKFIESVLEGTADATVRSEPEPENQPGEDGVFVLTGNNFMGSTIDSSKDVLIEFYAPWCGHCKALAPEYSEVAKSGAKNEKLVIAKMDATANDIPSAEFDVTGYPTLYFIKASADGGAGKVMSYSGGRTKDDIIKFIEEHSTNPVTFE